MKLLQSLSLFIVIGLLMGVSPDITKAQAVNNNGGNFAVGVMAGDPSGISVKAWNNMKSAWNFGMGTSFITESEPGIHVLADYEMHNWFNDNTDEALFGLYYGLGGRAIFVDEATNLGIRAPIGLNYVFDELPFGLFAEAAPILEVTPNVELDYGATGGVRVYL